MKKRQMMLGLLLAAGLLFTYGCGRKAKQSGEAAGWDLGPLHSAPEATYRLTVSGADRGQVRFEWIHQMMNGREVIVQRQHRSGATSGMVETVFAARDFSPVYVQTYAEVEGMLQEIRLDFRGGRVARTVSKSLFGGETVHDTLRLPEGTLDESELLPALRAHPLEPGQRVSWPLYSEERNRVDTAEVFVDNPSNLDLPSGTLRAFCYRVNVFGEERKVWVEEGQNRRVLQVEGPGQQRLEIQP